MAAYKHVLASGIDTIHLPRYRGLFKVTCDALRPSSTPRKGAITRPYHTGLGMQRIDGVRLDKAVDDLSEMQLKKLEDNILALIRSLHRDAGVCHGDISSANILVWRGGVDFVLLDFTEATIEMDVSIGAWAKARAQDIGDLRETFDVARGRKVTRQIPQ